MDVVVFEKGKWESCAACGMPYYLKGEVEDLGDLVAVTPEGFHEERNVDLRTGHEVAGIDPEGQTGTIPVVRSLRSRWWPTGIPVGYWAGAWSAEKARSASRRSRRRSRPV